jgi:hypothetical protein
MTFDRSEIATLRSQAMDRGLSPAQAIQVLDEVELLLDEVIATFSALSTDWLAGGAARAREMISELTTDDVREQSLVLRRYAGHYGRANRMTHLYEHEVARTQRMHGAVAVLLSAFGRPEREAFIAHINTLLSPALTPNAAASWWCTPHERLEGRWPVEALGDEANLSSELAVVIEGLAVEALGPNGHHGHPN